MGERTITIGVEMEPALRARLMAMLEEHRDAILAEGRAAGIAEERARVVAWLRCHFGDYAAAARCIEAGEHMPETGEEE